MTPVAIAICVHAQSGLTTEQIRQTPPTAREDERENSLGRNTQRSERAFEWLVDNNRRRSPETQ